MATEPPLPVAWQSPPRASARTGPYVSVSDPARTPSLGARIAAGNSKTDALRLLTPAAVTKCSAASSDTRQPRAGTHGRSTWDHHRARPPRKVIVGFIDGNRAELEVDLSGADQRGCKIATSTNTPAGPLPARAMRRAVMRANVMPQ